MAESLLAGSPHTLHCWPAKLFLSYIHNLLLQGNYIYTRLSTSGGYVLCEVYSNSDRQTFLNVFTYIIFIFTVYFIMSSGKP